MAAIILAFAAGLRAQMAQAAETMREAATSMATASSTLLSAAHAHDDGTPGLERHLHHLMLVRTIAPG